MKGFHGSYTVEAALYMPLIMSVLFIPLLFAMDTWREGTKREIAYEIQALDVVKEFYGYQVLGEIREETKDD